MTLRQHFDFTAFYKNTKRYRRRAWHQLEGRK